MRSKNEPNYRGHVEKYPPVSETKKKRVVRHRPERLPVALSDMFVGRRMLRPTGGIEIAASMSILYGADEGKKTKLLLIWGVPPGSALGCPYLETDSCESHAQSLGGLPRAKQKSQASVAEGVPCLANEWHRAPRQAYSNARLAWVLFYISISPQPKKREKEWLNENKHSFCGVEIPIEANRWGLGVAR